MTILNHNLEFTDGYRVLMLANRNKDGVGNSKPVLRVSSGVESFEVHFFELEKLANENSRIYATAVPRDLAKASRLFKFAQLEAEYAANPMDFYAHLNARWCSALMNEKSAVKDRKLWMFDCDTDEDYENVCHNLINIKVSIYVAHPTKSGYHIYTKPFDRSLLNMNVSSLLHTNPMMLWRY